MRPDGLFRRRSGRCIRRATRCTAAAASAPSPSCRARPDAAFVGVNRAADDRDRARACGARRRRRDLLRLRLSRGGGRRGAAGRRWSQAAGDMPILGPNCYGLINYLDGALLWPDQHGGRRVERGVAIVTQILQHRHQHDHAAARPADRLCGDRRQPGADRALRDRRRACSRTRASPRSACTSRGSTTSPRFEAMAFRARELGKPVVAMTVGRSEEARAATDLAHRLDRRLGGGDGRLLRAGSAFRGCAPSRNSWRR